MFSKLDTICHQDLLIVARFMIARDQCGSWFHGSCVGINEDMATSMETENIPFVFPECKKPGILEKCRRFVLSFCYMEWFPFYMMV